MTTDDAATRYMSLIEPVWLPLNESWSDDPDEFLRAFRFVRAEVGHLYAAHWCQEEICNGGLHQFFSNSTGLLAPEALAGLRSIGLTHWAAILAEAMQCFRTAYPRNRAERQESLARHQRRTSEKHNLFAALDDRFFAWLNAEPDRWERAADLYAERIAK